MYSSLRGIVEHKTKDWVEVVVGGVGYKVQVGENLMKLLKEGEEKKVIVYQVVSDSDLRLFGFENYEELAMFELLISVSGVGPKTAMQIVGTHKEAEIRAAVSNAKVSFFEEIKGIGKKTAQRIIVDLKGKIGGSKEIDLEGETEFSSDLLESLRQLGFEKKELMPLLKTMPEMESFEEQLRWCLKALK